jgi:hypothetical protein
MNFDSFLCKFFNVKSQLTLTFGLRKLICKLCKKTGLTS